MSESARLSSKSTISVGVFGGAMAKTKVQKHTEAARHTYFSQIRAAC